MRRWVHVGVVRLLVLDLEADEVRAAERHQGVGLGLIAAWQSDQRPHHIRSALKTDIHVDLLRDTHTVHLRALRIERFHAAEQLLRRRGAHTGWHQPAGRARSPVRGVSCHVMRAPRRRTQPRLANDWRAWSVLGACAWVQCVWRSRRRVRASL